MASPVQEHLKQYGVTVGDALNFINQNLGQPEVIFQTCEQYGVSNAHLAEITGYSESLVRDFWTHSGFDPGRLDDAPGRDDAGGHVIQLGRPMNEEYEDHYKVIDISNTPATLLVDFNGPALWDAARVIGFGADDRIVLKGAYETNAYAFAGKTNVEVFATSLRGSIVEFDLVGIKNASVSFSSFADLTGVPSFNALPVGDIYFG